MAYPFYERLQAQSRNMASGNFGLWFNKFVPIVDFTSCAASDDRGDKNKAVDFYSMQYSRINSKVVNGLLNNRHQDQIAFCTAMAGRYESVVIRAKLKTPLITGIGETHPHEVSMVFDHNMGIPYIPASGIKGIVRFAHTLGLLDEIPEDKIIDRDERDMPCEPYFDDEGKWTRVPDLFGTQEKIGSVIFLDAYPATFPPLHVDIMNPHYGAYYGNDKNEIPPADYLDPNPIKFLTVAKDTIFVFRALVDRDKPDLIEMVKAAFRKALTEEGVGAKTAVGYGIFDIEGDDTQSPKPSEPETWENVVLTYVKNTRTITVKWEGKKASTQDPSIMPEAILEKLKAKKRKKPVTATIKAQLIGGKEYRIIEIR